MNLKEELARILPHVLSTRDNAMSAAVLISRLKQHLSRDYEEESLKTTISQMAQDPNSVIASKRSDGGQGYFLRRMVDGTISAATAAATGPMLSAPQPSVAHWSADELLVTCDAYLRIREGQDRPSVVEDLATELRRRTIDILALLKAIDQTRRNEPDVLMPPMTRALVETILRGERAESCRLSQNARDLWDFVRPPM